MTNVSVEGVETDRDRPAPSRYTSLLLGFVAAMFVLAFIALAAEMLEGDTHGFDLLVAQFAQEVRRQIPWFTDAMRDLSGLGSPVTLGLFVALTSGFLLVVHRRMTALLVASSSALAALAVHLLKVVIGRPRPDGGLAGIVVSGLSFPSGHATMAAAIFLTVGAMIAGTRKRLKERAYIILAAVTLTAAVGLSRVMLGVHWAADVVGGWAFGAAWSALWLLVARHLARR